MTDGPKHTDHSLGRQNTVHGRSLRPETLRYLLLFAPTQLSYKDGVWEHLTSPV